MRRTLAQALRRSLCGTKLDASMNHARLEQVTEVLSAGEVHGNVVCAAVEITVRIPGVGTWRGFRSVKVTMAREA